MMVIGAPLAIHYVLPDVLVNIMAYIPLGFLFALLLTARPGMRAGLPLSVLASATISALLEYAQTYLPVRTSSNLDILSNTIGALLGVMLFRHGLMRGWLDVLERLRLEFVRPGPAMDSGIALFVMWMFAQINPALPMLGNIFVSDTAHDPFIPATQPFHWLSSLAIALNLLMTGCLLLMLLQRRRHAGIALLIVISTVAAAKFVAAALLLKSWALMLWLNGEAMLGVLTGLLLLALAARASEKNRRRLAITAACAYLAATLAIPETDILPSSLRMYHWREGHILTYNGMSHQILLLFPLLLLAHLWFTRKAV